MTCTAIENGKIAEHWDTIETIPARSEWKNPNGKFGLPDECSGEMNRREYPQVQCCRT